MRTNEENINFTSKSRVLIYRQPRGQWTPPILKTWRRRLLLMGVAEQIEFRLAVVTIDILVYI